VGREFRKLDREFLDEVVVLETESYPAGGHSEEDKLRIRRSIGDIMDRQDDVRAYYGLIEQGQLLAQMCLLTFDLNCRGQMIRAGGVGSVATALVHRKQGAARDLLRAGLWYYRNINVSMVTLYPFRFGFYRKMGFGYGAEVRRYRVDPAHFPDRRVPGVLRRYRGSESEREALLACYQTSLRKTHGMISRLNPSMEDAFRAELAPVVYEHQGRVEGYLVVDFERHYVMKNNLVVREWVYNTPEALYALASFLHHQVDQFEKIVLETQDPALAMILTDVDAGTYEAFQSQFVESHTSATGILYRVVDLPALFSAMGSWAIAAPDLAVKLVISDDFLPEHQSTTEVVVENGQFRVGSEHPIDGELRTDVATFSSLWMGAIDIDSAIRLGLVHVSSIEALGGLRALFRIDAKPQCWQHF